MVRLRAADGASAEIHSYGAHVTSWRPALDREERLFLSARSDLTGGSAIRGGIPVIFPQFAAEGPLPRHGFARTSVWSLVSEGTEDGLATASFSLKSSDATRAIWPAEFDAQLSVRVGGDELRVTLSVLNSGDADISFTCALHTYLRVHDTTTAEVIGLQGARYRVSSAPTELIEDRDEVIHITGEVDRVYVNAPRRVVVREPSRQLIVEGDAFPDVVLWNPGARAAALADMEPGGEHRMICIEAAAVQQPVIVAPHHRWSGTQVLTAARSAP